MAADRKFINATEAAAILDVDPRTFRDRYAASIVTLALPGSMPRYLKSDVEAFRDRHLVKPTRQLAGVQF